MCFIGLNDSVKYTYSVVFLRFLIFTGHFAHNVIYVGYLRITVNHIVHPLGALRYFLW